MSTRAVSLRIYRGLGRLLPFPSLDDKLFGVAFCAIHAPLVLLTGFVLAAGDATLPTVVLIVLASTLASSAVALWALHHLLAPVRLAARALRSHAGEGRLLPLPADLPDDMGQLLRDLRRALERLDEGRVRLDSLAEEDALTGLPNRRAGQRYLDLATIAAAHAGGPLCVVLLALEGAPPLRGRGSEARDRAVREAADFLDAACRRETDWLARWGDDDFLLVSFAAEPAVAAFAAGLQREFARRTDGGGGALRFALGLSAQQHREHALLCVQRAGDRLARVQARAPLTLVPPAAPPATRQLRLETAPG